MSKLFVLGAAAVFFVYGLLFYVIPLEAFEFVVDGSVTSSSGVTDMRATYGGMSVGIGIILFMLGRNPQTVQLGLVSVFVVMLGMAFGRSVGMTFDGNANHYMYLYLALELAVSFIALFLIKAGKGQ
ncbi:hypothetical protein D777_00188 [Marinobacter nitratireducens]|uniref:DUF4345 domain-containing protein n=1 Tax=Marinobacter nitratireducens TaxID=1137280 RepID=A0A072NJ70_9GAMM|nr:DUF4345 domain-containing protein [Marinobacter nitratireducens]KEF33180.1 hypothetical protein D777_00188 [Marinobacter nitratireducens]